MKATNIAIIAAAVLIGSAVVFSRPGTSATDIPAVNTVAANNVSVVNGVQIVEIRARGGYQPRKSVAKAGIPTVIRFNTSGTFDCSASVTIPSLGVREILPQSGSTDINIGNGELGTLKGSCGMGMYPFEIEFRS